MHRSLCAVAATLVLTVPATSTFAQNYEVVASLPAQPLIGITPVGTLLRTSAGILYGVTAAGGANGAGTIFRIGLDDVVTTIHSFDSTDGARPIAGLVACGDGYLCGTTSAGGTNGKGTIFRSDLSGQVVRLHSFDGLDGAMSIAELVTGSDGRLYGTTMTGGLPGVGTVFAIDLAGNFTLLHTFDGPGGSRPMGGLAEGSDGLLYGTTSAGGTNNAGTVFRLDHGGTLTTVRSLGGLAGTAPNATLTRAADGWLYGRTAAGSLGQGAIFKIDTSGQLVTMHAFTRAEHSPNLALTSALVQGEDGSFYGTSWHEQRRGQATIFRMSPDGTVTIIHYFSWLLGFEPHVPTGALVPDGAGHFYGLTASGGAAEGGTLYRVDLSGTVKTLHDFGSEPVPVGLIRASSRLFYGTTKGGGLHGFGTVFCYSVDGEVTVVHAFAGDDGKYPFGGLVEGRDGRLYGTTMHGGRSDAGTVFVLDGAGNLQTLHDFDSIDGARPRGELTAASDGFIYGTTYAGGVFNRGTIYRINGVGEFRRLHSFTLLNAGAHPTAGVIEGTDGNLYGSTTTDLGAGYGSAFRMTPAGRLTVLIGNVWADGWDVRRFVETAPYEFYAASFQGPPPNGGLLRLTAAPVEEGISIGGVFVFNGRNGSGPTGLTRVGDASLYGVTSFGGPSFEPDKNRGAGVIYRYTMDKVFSIVHAFDDLEGNPQGSPVQAPDGTLYGIIANGGEFGTGAIYRVTIPGATTTTLTVTPSVTAAGQPVTLTATVGGIGTTTGTVAFFDGTRTLATRSLTGGIATLVTTELLAGPHILTAAYSGDATHDGSRVLGVRYTVAAPANRAPLALSQSRQLAEGIATTIVLKAIDGDNDSLTFAVVGAPMHGTLSGAAPNLTYTPDAGYSGSDSFTFKANDGARDSNLATVRITIAPRNAPPSVQNLTVTTTAGTPVSGSLIAADPDGDVLTFTLVKNGAKGAAVLDALTGAFTATPNLGITGLDAFTFEVSDGLSERPATSRGVRHDQPRLTLGQPAGALAPDLQVGRAATG